MGEIELDSMYLVQVEQHILWHRNLTEVLELARKRGKHERVATVRAGKVQLEFDPYWWYSEGEVNVWQPWFEMELRTPGTTFYFARLCLVEAPAPRTHRTASVVSCVL